MLGAGGSSSDQQYRALLLVRSPSTEQAVSCDDDDKDMAKSFVNEVIVKDRFYRRSFQLTLRILGWMGCRRGGLFRRNSWWDILHFYFVASLFLLAVAIRTVLCYYDPTLGLVGEVIWYLNITFIFFSFRSVLERLESTDVLLHKKMDSLVTDVVPSSAKSRATRDWTLWFVVLMAFFALLNFVVTVFVLKNEFERSGNLNNPVLLAFIVAAKLPQSFVWLLQLSVVMHCSLLLQSAIGVAMGPAPCKLPPGAAGQLNERLLFISQMCQQVNDAIKWQNFSLFVSSFAVLTLFAAYYAHGGADWVFSLWLVVDGSIVMLISSFAGQLLQHNRRISWLCTHEWSNLLAEQGPDRLVVDAMLRRCQLHPMGFTLGESSIYFSVGLLMRLASLIGSAVLFVSSESLLQGL